MANYNLTNQDISASFQQLLQKNDDNGYLVNGTGSIVEDLTVSGSISASYFVGDGSGLTNLPIDSSITGSSLITASFASQTLTFTKGDGSQFSLNIPDVSGSDISALNQFTASQELLNATYATTGSNTFVGNQLIFGDISTIGGTGSFSSLNASGLNYPSVDNGELSFMQTDGNGNLSLQYVQTLNDVIYAGENIIKGEPVYVSGSQGANPIVYKADASDSSKAAIYISAEAINAGSTGRGIVLGHIEGIDLTGIAEGSIIYLAEGGGWSMNRPSGSNSIVQTLGIVTKTGSGGKGEVLNPGPAILPNLQSGYAWVGDGGNQPIAVSTGSWGGGGGTIDTGSFATTGSNSFVGDQTFPSQSISNRLLFDTKTSDGINDVQFGFGINGNGDLSISGSSASWGSNSGILTVAANNGWIEVGANVTNFNGSAAFRSNTQFRGITTPEIEPDFHHVAQFNNLGASGSFYLSGSMLANLQEGYAWVGDGSGVSQPFPTSSFAGSPFPYTGSLLVSSSASSSIIVPSGFGNVGLLVDGNLNVGDTIYTNSGLRSNGGVYTGTLGGNNPGTRLIITAVDTIFDTQQSGVPINVKISGSVDISGSLSADLQEGYVWVGDSNGRTTTVSTGSFGGGGGSTFPYTGDAEITGSLGVSNTITTQIFLNPQTLTGTQTVPAGYNGMLTGPVSNAGTIVIQTGSTLVII